MQVSHALGATAVSEDLPPVGSDGRPLQTSVCNDIEQSVTRTAEIERKLANSKVNYFFTN